MKTYEISKFGIEILKELGAEKAECTYKRSKKYEVNIHHGEVALIRTNSSNNILLKSIKGNKCGKYELNKIDPESLQRAAKETISLMESSQEDDAHDISPKVENKSFKDGSNSPDLELMCKRLEDFYYEGRKRYPKVLFEECVLDFTYTEEFFSNTNGVEFKTFKGVYTFSMVFCSKDEENTSSFNYTVLNRSSIDQDLIEWDTIDKLLQESEDQLNAKSISESFKGDIIISPSQLHMFTYYFIEHLTVSRFITDSSVLKDKIGKSVAGPRLTIHSAVNDKRISDKKFVTTDGFEARDMPIVEGGILKNYLLEQYGARKTSNKRSDSYCDSIIIENGDENIDDMIKTVKKGILLRRFSFGNPGDNGDFSGVAKNSYYIEDGEIKFPIKEVMITGNLFELFKNIKSISKETDNFGSAVIPWVKVSDLNISGN